MIEVNATTILVFVIVLIGVGGGGFWLRGLLTASTDDETKQGLNMPTAHELMICIHPTCQRRKTVDGWANERLLRIGYERYIKQCDKEQDMRKDNSICPHCIYQEGCAKANQTAREITQCEGFDDTPNPIGNNIDETV